MDEQGILDKIRKLLALSKSSNEYEAASALAMAVRLSRRYDIDLEKVEGTVLTDKIEGEFVFVRTQIERWVKSLFNGLAPLFGCECLYGHKCKTGRDGLERPCEGIIVYGQSRDKKAVEYVAVFLIRALRRLWLDHREEVVLKVNSWYSFPRTEYSIRQDYLCGAVVSVIKKAKVLFSNTKECEQTTALVLCKYQNTRRYIDNFVKPGKTRLNFGSSSMAGAFGRRDGDEIDILVPVESEKLERGRIEAQN